MTTPKVCWYCHNPLKEYDSIRPSRWAGDDSNQPTFIIRGSVNTPLAAFCINCEATVSKFDLSVTRERGR